MDPALRRQTLGDLLHVTAARFPERCAIECGPVRWTYAELDALCNRLARGLARSGVAYQDRIALLARNSHAFVALRFALARLGAILVPMNFMLRAEDVAHILRHSGARLLFTDLEHRDLAERAAQGTAVETLILLPDEGGVPLPPEVLRLDDVIGDDDAPVPSEVTGRSIAQILYTSGTESLPKG